MESIWTSYARNPAAYVVTIQLRKPLISGQQHLDLENAIQEWVKSLQTNGQFHYVESVTVSSTLSAMS